MEPIKEALSEMGIKGMSVYGVRGRGNQGGIWLTGRSGKYCVEWINKLKLEIVVSSKVNIDQIIETIIEKAQTGKPGDGKIFIYDIQEAIRIRTRERGEDIL